MQRDGGGGVTGEMAAKHQTTVGDGVSTYSCMKQSDVYEMLEQFPGVFVATELILSQNEILY